MAASSERPSPPHADVTLPVRGDELPDAARAVCCQLLPGWAALAPADVAVTVISGGITNSLLKVAPPLGSGLGAVVLRVFGTNTEIFIDRTRELEARPALGSLRFSPLNSRRVYQVLLQLNAAGFGAPVVATFANGRCEAFLQARPLEPAELADPELSPRVARLLRRFHAAPVDGPRDAPLWPLLRKWLDMAEALRLDDPARQAKLEALDAPSLRGEVDACEAACGALRSPVVYCHNDLLAPNVLLSTSEAAPGMLYLIDFEYGCYNYRGFDLGNHFNEWAGFDCEYWRYPDDAQQRAFLAAYAGGEAGPAPEAQSPEVDALVVEANVFSLASHLYWGIWALIQAKYSAIDFDYLDYHALRLAEYRRRRDGVLATVPHAR